jgi:hypothetical protein
MPELGCWPSWLWRRLVLAESFHLSTPLSFLTLPSPPPLQGHSTGCQDIIRYAQRYGHLSSSPTHQQQEQQEEQQQQHPHMNPAPAPLLMGLILQAPVSDREYLDHFPHLAQYVDHARQAVAEGRGGDIVFR